MNTQRCCQSAAHESRPRRGSEAAGWIISTATLILLPKCPACLAMYVALFSGIAIPLAGASILRASLLALCVGALLFLALRRLSRWIPAKKTEVKQ